MAEERVTAPLGSIAIWPQPKAASFSPTVPGMTGSRQPSVTALTPRLLPVSSTFSTSRILNRVVSQRKR
jgi:hypothetical protein